jgi:hypothetical protein
LQDVVVMDGRGSRVLERGKEYELGRVLVDDLMRAGYVTEATSDERRVTSEEGEPETATMAPAETTTMAKGRRRKGGGL